MNLHTMFTPTKDKIILFLLLLLSVMVVDGFISSNHNPQLMKQIDKQTEGDENIRYVPYTITEYPFLPISWQCSKDAVFSSEEERLDYFDVSKHGPFAGEPRQLPLAKCRITFSFIRIILVSILLYILSSSIVLFKKRLKRL